MIEWAYELFEEICFEEAKLLLEADLPEAMDLDYIGEIQVSSKKITIRTRKNAYTTALKLEPIIFEY